MDTVNRLVHKINSMTFDNPLRFLLNVNPDVSKVDRELYGATSGLLQYYLIQMVLRCNRFESDPEFVRFIVACHKYCKVYDTKELYRIVTGSTVYPTKLHKNKLTIKDDIVSLLNLDSVDIVRKIKEKYKIVCDDLDKFVCHLLDNVEVYRLDRRDFSG